MALKIDNVYESQFDVVGKATIACKEARFKILREYLGTFIGKVAVFATLEAGDLIQSLETVGPAVTLKIEKQ